MKVFCMLAILAVAVSALPVKALENGEDGWYVPQTDGSLKWISKADGERRLAELEDMDDKGLTTVPVAFYLFTKQNPTSGQKITDTWNSIANSNFNSAHPTRFIIHGWTQSNTAPMNKEITASWLSRGNFNVIVVDWARARSVEYASSVSAVKPTGKKVATMIDHLRSNHGMSMDNLMVIGHSLGAHVSGFAGKNVKTGRIHAIVGLDPALPFFSYNNQKRLTSSDAFYVESIQTNGGGLGFLKPIGKASFYPNGGKSQPGCTLDVTGACSHGRSTTYYAEAVRKDDFPSIKCGSYTDATKNQCGGSYSSVRMGGTNNAYAGSGDYYVPVHSKAPHGYGA